jgi:hypothetical protein
MPIRRRHDQADETDQPAAARVRHDARRLVLLVLRHRGAAGAHHVDRVPGEPQIEDRSDAGDDPLEHRGPVAAGPLSPITASNACQTARPTMPIAISTSSTLPAPLPASFCSAPDWSPLLARAEEGDLEGDPGEEQVNDAVADEAGAGHVFQRLAVGRPGGGVFDVRGR